jgi:hypothetical protein
LTALNAEIVMRTSNLSLLPIRRSALQRCMLSVCVMAALGPANAAWVTVFPPVEPIEVRVFAEPGAQLYSRFDPRFKMVSPKVSGGCPDEQRLKEGWINIGGVYGGIPMSTAQQRFGSGAVPTTATVRVDMQEHMQMPPGTPTDGNSAGGGAQRTGGLLVPNAVCNGHLAKLGSQARAAAAHNGFTVNIPQALRVIARVDCTGSFKVDDYMLPVTARCEPAPALIERVTLRVEWSQQDACPDEVRLIGQYDSNFAHAGKRLFMGNHYLTAPEAYQIGNGRATVMATRKLDWAAHAQGTLASAPGSDATIDGWAQFNLQPDSQKAGAPSVFTSERVPFRVTCKKQMPPRAPASIAPPVRMKIDAPKR